MQANLHSSEVIGSLASKLSFRRTKLVRRLANTQMSPVPGGRIVRRLFARQFDATIACAGPVADAYRAGTGVAEDRNLFVIPNGCNAPAPETSVSGKLDARNALGISKESFVVLHIGRMMGGPDGSLRTGQKAHDTIIRSFAKAFTGEDVALVLVGDGPLKDEIEALAEQLHVRKQVQFLGLLDQPWQALIASDILFFPSRHEGIPNVILEAACMGVPIVASDIDETRYLDLSGQWLFGGVDDVDAFAEALKNVRSHHAAVSRAAISALPQFRAEFSMRTCAIRYLEVYAKISGGSVKSEI
jgi:glycosyltransferase involved in cell wall biosynthesis